MYVCPHGKHPADCDECTSNAPLTDVPSFRLELARRARLLDQRDAFIVREGLWDKYIGNMINSET